MKPSTIICPKCQTSISVDEAMQHQMEEEKKRLWKIAQEKALEKISAQKDEEFKLLKEESERKNKELEEARANELKLRQEKNKLDDEKKAFELEKQRQLDEDREKIRKNAEETEAEKHRLLEAEKNKQIEDMKKTILELQQKANQGSQQLQGEVLELELEAVLKSNFETDEIVPVPKGINGADILQKVRDKSGVICGIIVWESKRTKDFKKEWISKLKEDSLRVKGDVSILVTLVLPDDIKYFGLKDGILITSYDHFLNIAQIIRKNLFETQREKSKAVGKNEKMEMLYNYIYSNEFIQKMELMLEACNSMRITLQKERLAMEKIWSQREKEIDKIASSTATIHGSLTGISGNSMPEIDSLEPEILIGSEKDITQSALFEETKIIES